jgi:TATA-box binding protein (TBP) (component of TFIID and TFIIIB)
VNVTVEALTALIPVTEIDLYNYIFRFRADSFSGVIYRNAGKNGRRQFLLFRAGPDVCVGNNNSVRKNFQIT